MQIQTGMLFEQFVIIVTLPFLAPVHFHALVTYFRGSKKLFYDQWIHLLQNFHHVIIISIGPVKFHLRVVLEMFSGNSFIAENTADLKNFLKSSHEQSF